MTDNPYKKTLPRLDAADAIASDTLFLVRRAGETKDRKLTAADLAEFLKEHLSIPTITIGPTPPEEPQEGDLWVDTN